MSVRQKFIIGCRASKLALAQTEIVARILRAQDVAIEIRPMTTSGDKVRGSLTEQGGKGLFVKELEEALFDRRIDIAVHSLKDMPGTLPSGLAIASVLRREDPRDVLISRQDLSFEELVTGTRIGTSSPRRKFQLLRLRPDLQILPIRGNVETRVKKLQTGEYDAILLAAAGLRRLGMEEVITAYLPVDQMIPAIGQGIVAIETREDDHELMTFVRSMTNDEESWIAAQTERSLLQTIGGDCFTPIGAYAQVEGERVILHAFLADPTGTHFSRAKDEDLRGNAGLLGRRVGLKLLPQLS